jgi:hypothetical protein
MSTYQVSECASALKTYITKDLGIDMPVTLSVLLPMAKDYYQWLGQYSVSKKTGGGELQVLILPDNYDALECFVTERLVKIQQAIDTGAYKF